MTKPKIIPEKMHILQVRIIKSLLDCSKEFKENPQKPPFVRFGYGSEMGFNLEESKMRIRLNVLIEGIGEDNSEFGISAEYGVEFHCLVENLEDFIFSKDEENNLVDFDGQFAATILGISYSTCRGIISERLNGTYLEGILLPIINPAQLADNNQNKDKSLPPISPPKNKKRPN